MTNRIHQLMDTANILTQVNANQRLVMKLADFYRAQSRSEENITLHVAKKLLATQLGMTAETLSKTFKKLKKDGFITEYESHITLLEIPAMCEMVELAPKIFQRDLT
jgi:CRP/FNR family transcriptional regulator